MPSTTGRASRKSSIASSCWCASEAASARASSASAFVRSSVETPDERKPGSTSSRSASHATVASVGRVLPRSIWLTYSFENRSPASCVCVSPFATRSARRRSPRRDPPDSRGEEVVAVCGMSISE